MAAEVTCGLESYFVVIADGNRKTPSYPTRSLQSLGRSGLGRCTETIKCEPRLLAAWPNVERSLRISCSRLVSTKPFLQLGAVDQRGISAVRAQRNRFCKIRHRALPVRSLDESIGALAVDRSQDVGCTGIAVIRRESFHQPRVVRVRFYECSTVHDLQVILLFGIINRATTAARIEQFDRSQ